MASIFSKIINGTIPCYKVAESENYLAFLDVNPLVKGHVLVVPKIEVDVLFDLDQTTYVGLWEFSHNVARALKAAITCNRIGVAVIGLEVPHAHIHLIPINSMNDMNFSNDKLKLEKEEFITIAEKISQIFFNQTSS